MARKFCAAIMMFAFILAPLQGVYADDYWEREKEFTAWLAESSYKTALVVLASAKLAVEAAKNDLARAQAALNAAKTAAAAAVAAAEVAGAEAVLASAMAVLASAETAAAAAGAAVAGAVIGTAVGQGLGWLISACWDPICDLTFIDNGDTYTAVTKEEIDVLVPQMTALVMTQGLTKADFEAAGETGVVAWDFLAQNIRMFLGFARASAAATAGKNQLVLKEALPDLQNELDTLPNTIRSFAATLKAINLESPREALAEYAVSFASEAEMVKKTLNPEGAGYAEAVVQINKAVEGLEAAQESVAAIAYAPLMGTGGLLGDATKDYLQKFINQCSEEQEACLPEVEIKIVKALLSAAGVYSPTVSGFEKALAEYDATGNNESNLALFSGDESLTVAELLEKSATQLSHNGSWLGISLKDSTLARELRSQRLSNALYILIPIVIIIIVCAISILVRKKQRKIIKNR